MSALTSPHAVVTLDEWCDRGLSDVTARVRNLLHERGCALVRIADGASGAQFVELAALLADGPLQRGYGDLPSTGEDSPVYRSTPYPARERILWHHEAAHTGAWPHIQFFHCTVAPAAGGATPTADSRLVYELLPTNWRDRFTRFGLRYIRNFREHVDVSWRAFFGVATEEELTATCARQSIGLDWLPDGTVRTSFRTAAAYTADGRPSFANQVLLHHNAALPARTRAALHGLYGPPEAFPRHVQLGNGEEIPAAVIELIAAAYDAVAIRTAWRNGDILILDNRVTAHSRDPFQGERQVRVALGPFHQRTGAQ